ncbi:hypothetical protein FX988_03452 [Paraglaciecola mesophila]|uniref:Methyltransferase domain-containing protein n=1 Tax=Paraglaciecola mesophila TaxID=197222 RepID=A0A857JMS9_9ALTE|nr:methyltransferase [Paraglaciecola mesophila]QHJ13193.1 hypothetical protein FX988_03452 [Paraglaciecola mesophila]
MPNNARDDFNYAHRLEQLTYLLSEHKALWQFATFNQSDLPWRENYPELCDWLDSQSVTDLLSDDTQARIGQFLPFVSQIVALTQLDDFTLGGLTPSMEKDTAEFTSVPVHFSHGIGGRKWQQISAFFAALGPAKKAENYLEWCAGMGHLGRLVALKTSSSVHSLEWQQALCDKGRTLAQKANVQQGFVCDDALAAQSATHLTGKDCAIALHACGDLHTALLRAAGKVKTPQVVISPCCYHLTQDARYVGLSQFCQANLIQYGLELDKDDLKLAVKQVATAGAREQDLRELELTYRLGFDTWLRETLNADNYIPLPSVKKSQLNQGFEAFCHWAAEQKNQLFNATDEQIAQFLAIGKQRRTLLARLEAVRSCFRRAMELWLVLDRALFMQEQGYQVEVGLFCAAQITPRNYMLRAVFEKYVTTE